MRQKPKPWEYAVVAAILCVLGTILYPVFARVYPPVPRARVEGADRQPVPGATVRFRDRETGRIVSFTTDTDGGFRWRGLREVEGYWPSRLAPRYEPVDHVVAMTYRQTGGPGGFVLSRPGTYTFRAVTPDGKPVPSVPLFFQANNRILLDGTRATDKNGTLAVADVPVALPERVVHIGVDDPRWASVDQTRRITLDGVEYRITVLPAATIGGSITHLDGAPVRGLRVNAFPKGNKTGFGAGWAGNTGADGRFEVRGLPPGSYTLRVMPSVNGLNTDHWSQPVVTAESGKTVSAPVIRVRTSERK